MLEGLIEYKFTDSRGGDIHALVPKTVGRDNVGALRCLQGTPWYDQIPSVSKESFEKATLGWIIPLLREIGPHPHGLFKTLPERVLCKSLVQKECEIADKKICFPCTKMPDCYEPSGVADPQVRLVVSAVVRAWKEGRYVFIVGEK